MAKILRDPLYWDKRLSWATAFFFICDVANSTVKSVFNIPESLWGAVSAMFGVAILVGFALSFKEMLRRSSKLFWRTVFVFIVVYCFTAIQYVSQGYPLQLLIKGNIILTFAWWIPVGVYAASVEDKSVFYNVWLKASYIITAACILLFVFHRPNEEQSAIEYNISFGYKIILPLIFQTNEFLRNKKIWLFALIVLQIILIFIYSSRGPLLAFMFFCIYKFAFESNSRIRKVISVFILAIAGFVMIASLQTIAESAVAILDMFGYESRTLTLIASGIGDKSSGRDEIWNLCYKMIEEKPILGWGLGGEYVRLGWDISGTPATEVTAEGHNPHNGLVQNFVNFGVIGGLAVNLLFVLPFFHLKKFSNKDHHDMLLVFASACVIPLFVSSAGFFIKPGTAIFFFLYYCRRRCLQRSSLKYCN